MSRSESAYKDVAEELRRIRPRVMAGDASVIDNAVDLLISAHNFLEEDDYDEEEINETEPAFPFTFGNPPSHMQLFCLGDILLFAISIDPLTEGQHEELTRRCSFPLDLALSPDTELESIRLGRVGVRPVYDRKGQLIGTYLDVFPFGQGSQVKLKEGGEA